VIQIYTALSMTKDEQSKKVVMELDATDAFFLATLLINTSPDDLPDEWRDAVHNMGKSLIHWGNACR
jgi:hypothetical protein